jgi:hypothetical protein
VDEKRKGILDQLRESKPVKALDVILEDIDKFLGPSGKAWLANGLDELRQAIAHGNTQVQGGNNPGLWGTITTGEATAERMGNMSLDDLRGYAAAKAKEAENAMDKKHDRDDREM